MKVWQAVTPEDRSRSLAARHAIFCEGRGGEPLENCPTGGRAGAPHDRYDADSILFGVSTDPDDHPDGLRQDIATARLVLGDRLPTAAILPSLDDPLRLDPHRRYCEPSRVGIYQEFRGTPLGMGAMLGVMGAVFAASVRSGSDDQLMTMRWDLYAAVSWFPFEMADPFLYPRGAGGPETDELIYLATLNVHAVVKATRLLRPAYSERMFPGEPDWYQPDQAPSETDLRERWKSNQRFVRRWRADYRTRRVQPRTARIDG